MAGTSPAMTPSSWFNMTGNRCSISRTAEEVDRLPPALEFVFRNHHNRAGFAVDAKRLTTRSLRNSS